MSEILWHPRADEIEKANLTAFMRFVNERHGLALRDFADLHRWSVDHCGPFWESVWTFTGIRASRAWDDVLVDGDRMPGARWFTGAKLNYAENLLRDRSDSEAVVFWGESGIRRRLTHAQLWSLVSRLARALRESGIGPGDRVAAFTPNLPETIAAMLAVASVGAVWSSCSPDFGIGGVLDRFGQIAPRALFAADGYSYAGKRYDVLGRVRGILDGLSSIERTVVIPCGSDRPDLAGIRAATAFEDFLGPQEKGEIAFEQLPFDHPLFIMFTSGTTGLPKCMVHSAGGTLIQHLKEHVLHCDFRPGERVFYYTTCGWMMWNWLASALASGVTLMLYEGSPFHPNTALWDFASAEGIHHFGTSAKYISAMEKIELEPARTHDLRPLRSILSTGSPLSPDSFDYVYRRVKRDVCLSSISGGTDIISCFALGSPVLPVVRGELQCLGLGMKVQVFDESGRAVVGRKGELVCSAPFPSMPVTFWNDPDGSRYRAAYFQRFPGVWWHGDYAELTPRGGLIIYGRSDAVLNPGGVRIGTSEIYRIVDSMPEVVESIVVGQEWKGDTRVVLFVHLREGLRLDNELRQRIRRTIRTQVSPRHVPAKILQVAAIPRTITGKLVELAVREAIHGRPIKNRDALANPEALDQYSDVPELRED